MRDLLMAAIGAASGLGFVVIAFVLIKRRERAEMRRLGIGHGEFIGGLSRDEYTVHDEFD